MNVQLDHIRAAIRDRGLTGKPLFVHSSLRSFGWVEGGAATVIGGLLAEGCTVAVPTMSWMFAVPPPPDLRPSRNAWDYEKRDVEFTDADFPGMDLIFTPESQEISKEMGAIPAELLRRDGRIRGRHPMDSFAAIGPLAETLMRHQTPEDPFAPFRALAEMDGHVILMGVGLNRLTLLHHAEELAGRNLFMRWANDENGKPIGVRGGDCSDGFPNLAPVLAQLTAGIQVGSSTWQVLPVAATLAVASEAIRTNPSITKCGDAECPGCRDAMLGGPIFQTWD